MATIITDADYFRETSGASLNGRTMFQMVRTCYKDCFMHQNVHNEVYHSAYRDQLQEHVNSGSIQVFDDRRLLEMLHKHFKSEVFACGWYLRQLEHRVQDIDYEVDYTKGHIGPQQAYYEILYGFGNYETIPELVLALQQVEAGVIGASTGFVRNRMERHKTVCLERQHCIRASFHIRSV